MKCVELSLVAHTLLSLAEVGPAPLSTLASVRPAPGPRCPVSGPEYVTVTQCAAAVLPLLPTSGVIVSGSSSTISPGPEKHALVRARASELETEPGDRRPEKRLLELSILA